MCETWRWGTGAASLSIVSQDDLRTIVKTALIPVVLSGGAGTRLWPVSREALPKPFMKLGDGRSLLRMTLDRAAALSDEPALVVTNRDYYFLSRDELAGTALSRDGRLRYLLEPAARNTAPAIALATLAVAATHGEDALLLVLAADHLIQDEGAFGGCVRKATDLAAKGWLVTFGIEASGPETGYGYIESGKALDGGGFEVQRFVEKPSLERAREFLAAGNYSWNSGMFCFRASDMLAAFDEVAPAMAAAARASWAASRQNAAGVDATEIDAASFAALDSISIDYAVFEKAKRVAVVPGRFGWSDVGAWPEIAGQFPADANGNRAAGRGLFIDSKDCFVHAHGRLVAVLGLQDTVVIDTPDALLVMPKARAQDVKKVVAELEKRGG